MDTLDSLIAEAERSHSLVERIVADLPAAAIFWRPAATANSIGAAYLHSIFARDHNLLRVIQEMPPLWQSEWSQRLGGPPDVRAAAKWAALSEFRYELAAARGYAQAVHQALLAYLRAADAAELARVVDAGPLGKQTIAYVINAEFLWHTNFHGGEIACLKGLQGLKGLPF